MKSTATPDLAAARASDPPLAALTRGSTAHGASSPGRIPAEVEPIKIVKVGQRTKARPATTLDRSVPIRTASASLTSPAKPAATRSESQNRSVTQIGTFSSWPAR